MPARIHTGYVFSFGHGAAGQLGLGDLRDYRRPTLVRDLVDARACVRFSAAGDGHSVFLTDKGRVWVCGAGEVRNVVARPHCVRAR